MVARFFNRVVYLIYRWSRSYLLKRNCLVYKKDFDFEFWGGGV